MDQELITYRADDLPLLYGVIKTLGIASCVNKYIKVHGNWSGTLPGEILEFWLCYMLSECDHRLSGMQEWAKHNLDFLRIMSGCVNLSSHDFSDDKLGLLLDYFSKDSVWAEIETSINGSILGVYRLEEEGDLNTFRLDAAPMQSYGKVVEKGLLQYGYHKHHADLPQFKLKLCTLDNAVNHFAYPVCHLTVNGKIADDELYISIISKSKKVLRHVAAYESGNLYVGDSKFGSIANRLFVFKNKDYYLMPLSGVQLSEQKRRALIDSYAEQDYQRVMRRENKKEVLVAEGFELDEQMQVESEGQVDKWKERRVFVHSINYAKSQKTALEKRLSAAQLSITELTRRKQGKAVLKTTQEYEQAIDNILKTNKVEGLVRVEIKESQTKIEKRAYGKRPKRIEVKSEFELFVQREEAAIRQRKKYMGWQVYATNAPKDLLTFEKCVWKYRYQSNIESRFDDIRNKMAALLPVYLQKDSRIKGLVNILLLALKICSMLEYKAAKSLQDQKELLYNVYEGNPNRGTNRPSAKRLLTAFQGVSISVIFQKGYFQLALMTKLKPVQKKILQLLDLDIELYTGLTPKTKLFFSQTKVIET